MIEKKVIRARRDELFTSIKELSTFITSKLEDDENFRNSPHHVQLSSERSKLIAVRNELGQLLKL